MKKQILGIILGSVLVAGMTATVFSKYVSVVDAKNELFKGGSFDFIQSDVVTFGYDVRMAPGDEKVGIFTLTNFHSTLISEFDIDVEMIINFKTEINPLVFTLTDFTATEVIVSGEGSSSGTYKFELQGGIKDEHIFEVKIAWPYNDDHIDNEYSGKTADFSIYSVGTSK